jgi:hypothetical protein
LTMRIYCDNCDRDISDDGNRVHVRLESNLAGFLEPRGHRPLIGKDLDYCVECAKLHLAPAWELLIKEKTQSGG